MLSDLEKYFGLGMWIQGKISWPYYGNLQLRRPRQMAQEWTMKRRLERIASKSKDADSSRSL